MNDEVERAIAALEQLNRELIADDPCSFETIDATTRRRATVIDQIAVLLQRTTATPEVLRRLKSIHLTASLTVERIHLARQSLRNDLNSLNQQGHMLSGYHANSSARP